MSEIIVIADRLRLLIERRSFKMREFAELSGVYPTTLSRYVNGKQAIPDKYIRKAAELLNVTPEYLRCESDDFAPPRVQDYASSISQEMLDYNRQQYRFSHMSNFLESMGVKFLWHASVGEVVYHQSESELWSCESDSIAIVDTDGLLKLFRDNPDKCQMWVDAMYRDRTFKLTYTEYQKWLRCLVASMELEIQKKFDLFYNIQMSVADSDINRALKGEDFLSWKK